MGIIVKNYQKSFLQRFDKDGAIPYYCTEDFPGLKCEQGSYKNSSGVLIQYFTYNYDNYYQDKLILFCPGMGPGHTAYFSEIDTLCKAGYRVLTLDYTGCGESKGPYLGSLNTPTRDTMDLLNLLNLDKPIVVMGHSLGGFTALKVASLRKEITKVVVMSPIVTIRPMIFNASKSKFITHFVLKYERKVEKEYDKIDVPNYLKTTSDDILFIQSVDDPMVPYETSLKVAEESNNPHIQTIKFENRKHNPNYTLEAVQYMNEVFGAFNRRVMDKAIATDEERITYFKDVSIKRLTEQDQNLFNQIEEFISK